jgi:hypothetical protein
MWTIYRVKWEFITQLCASVPGQSKLIQGWLEARAPTARPPQSKSLDEIASEVIETLGTPEQEPEKTTLIFQRVNGVLAVRMATIKAHLKDCSYQIQTYTAGYVAGDKSLRTKISNGLYWPMEAPVINFNGTPFVPILNREGQPLTEPTGVREKAIHVLTPMGQRSALKAFEYIENAVIEFPLAVLTAPTRFIKRGKEIVEVPGRPVVNLDDLKTIFLYGSLHGYAGERSEDGGRYAAEIKEQGETNG